MDNTVTLWQFLLHLLQEPHHKQLICWTSNDGEFKLLQAEEVARLWGVRKNKPSMNYDKLSRALRYYYVKNIIKKVNGQKFVYKFVSYPDILSMDPITLGRAEAEAEGRQPEPVSVCTRRDKENYGKERVTGPSGKSSGRNDYIHSGLYTSFTLNSLNTGVKLFKSITMENPVEKKITQEAAPSVIRFVTTPARNPYPVQRISSIPPQASDPQEKPAEPPPNISITSAMSPHASSISPIPEPSGSSSPALDPNQDMGVDTDLESVGSQSLEFAQDLSMEVTEIEPEPEAEPEPEPYVLDMKSTSKSKKPKGLDLAPVVVITTSDSNHLGMLSPSMPTASLTPAFFSQTPILLTPSPLLSSIHFWSTLSPVATLSPARLHGASTLFQFPSVYNSHMPLTLSSFDTPSTPGPYSPDLHKS